MLFIIVVFNFILYYLLVLKNNLEYKIIFSFLFIVCCLIIKNNTEVANLHDYGTYYQVIGSDVPFFSIDELFSEPYFFQISNYFYLNSHSATHTIVFFYDVNFYLTLFFFVWLSFLKNIAAWKKVVLFSLYYYLYSYILLRNTPAYVLVGILFCYLHKNKYFYPSALSFMAHLSALPILMFSVFKNKTSDKKMFLLLVFFFLSLNVIFRLPFFGLQDKLLVYQEDQEYGRTIIHKIYFAVIIFVHVFLFFKKRMVVYNYTYSFIFLIYIFLQILSPVMGFRFSVYLILYLLLNPELKFDSHTERRLDTLSFMFIILGVNSYYNLSL